MENKPTAAGAAAFAGVVRVAIDIEQKFLYQKEEKRSEKMKLTNNDQ